MKEKTERKPIILRLPIEVVKRIDKAAEEQVINRTVWITLAIVKELNRKED